MNINSVNNNFNSLSIKEHSTKKDKTVKNTNKVKRIKEGPLNLSEQKTDDKMQMILNSPPPNPQKSKFKSHMNAVPEKNLVQTMDNISTSDIIYQEEKKLKKIKHLIKKKSFKKKLIPGESWLLKKIKHKISNLYISDVNSLVCALQYYTSQGNHGKKDYDLLCIRFLELQSIRLSSNLFPKLTPEDGIKCIVQRKNWENIYNNCDQTYYSHEMIHSIQMGCLYLKNETPICSHLLSLLATGRLLIASKTATSNDRDRVGAPRLKDQISTTEIKGTIYNEVFERLNKKVKEDANHQFFHTHKDRNENDIVYQVIKINGEKIYGNSFPADLNEQTNLTHTAIPQSDKIMRHVENTLFPEALIEEDPEKLTEKLGEIFWMICQAKPWKLGDPSIAEMLIKSIWLHKTGKIPAWKVGIIPWVEAITEPDIEKFKANFKNQIEWI